MDLLAAVWRCCCSKRELKETGILNTSASIWSKVRSTWRGLRSHIPPPLYLLLGRGEQELHVREDPSAVGMEDGSTSIVTHVTASSEMEENIFFNSFIVIVCSFVSVCGLWD